ncbi:PREDICTED: neural Wiskott-Aldrich syndrome protein-like, partial [Nipponia nippon]|uniref:neural Wiskott-Aldrich syndrome protein-like n=1 Tax=Nipponia nippon TaxID=128390 RepID=UPI000510DD95
MNYCPEHKYHNWGANDMYLQYWYQHQASPLAANRERGTEAWLPAQPWGGQPAPSTPLAQDSLPQGTPTQPRASLTRARPGRWRLSPPSTLPSQASLRPGPIPALQPQVRPGPPTPPPPTPPPP